MVAKNKSQGVKAGDKGKLKVGKLQLNKETVKNLTGEETKGVKGGVYYPTIGTCPKDPLTQTCKIFGCQ